MFDPGNYRVKLEDWLRAKVGESGRKGLIFGLSGGVDSAVVAALAQSAFPDSSLGLILPCESDPADREDALLVAGKLGLSVEEMDLGPVFTALIRSLPVEEGSALSRANIKPRLRMTALYYHGSLRKYLVTGTSNASELFTGYFTKYGDAGVDIMPLANLVKREVIALAKYIGIPSRIVDKPPSGGLWLGQTDEEEMGTTYEAIDAYLRGEEVKEADRQRISRMEVGSRHKRIRPPAPDF